MREPTRNLPSPSDAFSPLPREHFDRACAGHLLRRLGYATSETSIVEAQTTGHEGTVKKAYGQARPMPKPEGIDAFDEEAPAIRKKARELPEAERKQYFDDIRRRARAAYGDYAIRWFDFASIPENGPREKAVAWLQNILVVGAQKVRTPGHLFDYQETLRRGLDGNYPDLLRDVMRHPAMIRYLDLNNSSAKAPNENFARELFELFALGEGHYSEQDIKEAARSLTGIRLRDGAYHFDRRTHDPRPKTLFGSTGNWGPEDVIRLTAAHPDFPAFIADDFIKTFVTRAPIPRDYAIELGRRWKAAEFRILALPEIVFTSRFFYHPTHRAALIKSPHEFYLGLCADLRLATAAYPGDLLPHLRNLGQNFFDPPNVRGWVGDKTWINSSTYAARRQLVAALFRPLDEPKLNADDRAAVERSREAGRPPLRVDAERIQAFADSGSPESLAKALESRLLPGTPSAAFHNTLVTALTDAPAGDSRIIRDAVIAILQSPAYQLC